MENYLFLILVVILLIAFPLIIKFILKPKTFSSKAIDYSYYSKKDYLLTRSELAFYKVLSEALAETNLYICPQVKLEDLIQTRGGDYTIRNRIKQKHIDFVITDKNNMKIVCAIELDDYTHGRLDRQERDIFVEGLFSSINVKLLRYRNNYSKELLLRDVLDTTKYH